MLANKKLTKYRAGDFSMSKIPKLPEQIFEQFTADYKNIFGENLVSIILTGSAARGEYVPKKSDINFLIVLSTGGLDQLSQTLPLVKKWHKQNVSTPLFLTKEYIHSALDSYPIEFLLMKQHHQVVYGEEVFSGMKIAEKDLRLECEREIRGKLLLLRKSYLNTYGKTRSIKDLIRISIPTFTSIFSALLHLKKLEIPLSKLEIYKTTAEEFGINFLVFEKLIKVTSNHLKLNKEQLNKLMEQFISQINELTKMVDKL
jgi:predicted nucleotidyltransferase